MKTLLFSFLVLFSFTPSARAAIANPDLAKAILEDGRLLTFVKLMEKNYQASCPLPPYDHLEAEIHQVGPGGDFTSIFHKFTVPCKSLHDLSKPVVVDGTSVEWVNLAAIEVNAEVNLPIVVLNVTAAAQFQR